MTEPVPNTGGDQNQAPIESTPPPRRRGVLGTLWFVVKAIEIRLRFIAVLVGIGLVIGYWDTLRNYWDKWTRPATGAAVSLSADNEFYCPMHPSVVRDKPDAGGAVPKCPICGMPLSKRKKGEAAALPEGIVSRVQLSPYRVQLAGIRTEEIELQPLTVDLRAVGYVAVDERKLSRIVIRAAGYVEKLYVNESFAEVTPGEPLAEIYSPELYSAAQELLIARGGGAGSASLVQIAREKLKLLGVADKEIEEIERSGQAPQRLVIRSPHGGHVFEKRIIEGDQVTAGQMLFEVADLSTIWIEAEVYEKDAGLLRKGQAVDAAVEAYPGQVFAGRLSLIHPHVETATRTMRVRFELDNPGHALRPGMFATVHLSTPVQELEPFRSELATQQALTQATDEAALIAMQEVCPVTGAKLGSMGAPLRATANGQTVFLCCAGCEGKLADRPDYYLSRLSRVSERGVLSVPEQSVIDTGTQKVVYIEREPGLFEGVAVTLGPRSGGYYAVIDGLLPGDRVAAAGAFLVDAETRLNPTAAAAYFGASGGPSSGTGAPAHEHSPAAANGPKAATGGIDAKA
ncbi:MAG: efflux RND transporter periplasmic adaptor subunit, partial [Planctomycetaceae bacterium]|nr:efflux RND transporter periplasmic adaptor subunit [Planctomycetaceae bacterium]